MTCRPLSGHHLLEWMDKNAHENQGYQLKVGDQIYSAIHMHRGRIHEIKLPDRSISSMDRGRIVVQLHTGGQYVYDWQGWQNQFRISRHPHV